MTMVPWKRKGEGAGNKNKQENNNITFGRLEGSRNTKRGFGRVLARKAKKGEKFWSAGSTGLTKFFFSERAGPIVRAGRTKYHPR